MKVEIFSDVVCPFCWIGKRQFEIAIEQLELTDDLEVIYRSYELDPNMSKEINLDVYDLLSKKYGISREQAIESNVRVSQMAETVGLEFHVEKAKAANSFDAHRLIHFAKQYGKDADAYDLLHKAYFSDGIDINNIDNLCEIALQLEIDISTARNTLESDDYSQQVREDEQRARDLGISGVPFFVFNDEYGVSGAQGIEQFKSIINQIQE